MTSTQFQSAYTTFLRSVRARATETKAAVSARNKAGDAEVFYVSTAGWLSASDFADGTHPTAQGHTIIAHHLAPIIAAKL